VESGEGIESLTHLPYALTLTLPYVESGEGIERCERVRQQSCSATVWNPVKELKAKRYGLREKEHIGRVESVESGEGIESNSGQAKVLFATRVESGEGIESQQHD